MVSARHWKSPTELGEQGRDGRGAWLVSGSSVFRIGADFLGLLHESWVAIGRFMEAPVMGDPPPSAEEFSAEIQGYCVSNQHTFGDEYDDAWTEIDDERDELQNREEPIAKRRFVSKLRYCRAWEEFLEMYKGPVSSANCGVCPHCCDSLPSMLELERCANRVFCELMFQTLPTNRSKGRSATRGPCLDWWLVSFTMYTTLQSLAHCSREARCTTPTEAGARGPACHRTRHLARYPLART